MLRNVNLRSHSGTQVCYTRMSRRCFLVMEDTEDSAAGPSQHPYLAESNAETSAEHSRRLSSLRKVAKESVHCRSQESKKRTSSSKVESIYWRTFTSHVLAHSSCYYCFVRFFGLPLNKQHTTSDTCSVCPTCMCNAPRHTGASCGTSYYKHL